jgi:hypothetical protein
VAADSLIPLLERRLAVIADHAWRDRDAVGHLDALRDASESLDAAHAALHGQLPARLAHFLERRSFDKALAFLRGTAESEIS